MTGPVAFVDCETSGLDPDRHEIWEVGIVYPDGNESRWFLPIDLGRADPFALQIGRYHQRHPKGYEYVKVEPAVPPVAHLTGKLDDKGLVEPGKFAAEFARATFGLHICGAVISFDDQRLAKLLRAHGEQPGWHYHIIDVEALAVGWLIGTYTAIQGVGKNPEEDGPTEEEAMLARPPWDSRKLSAAVGVDLTDHDPDGTEAHTALGDARWARALYRAVMGS